MDKETDVNLSRGILLWNTKEWIIDTHVNLDRSQGIMLREKSQSQKVAYYMIPCISHSWNSKMIAIRSEENRSMVARGSGGMGIEGGCDYKGVSQGSFVVMESIHVNKIYGIIQNSGYMWNLCKVCSLVNGIPGFDNALWLYKMLLLGEAGWRVHRTSLYYFSNFLWVYNYFKIKI